MRERIAWFAAFLALGSVPTIVVLARDDAGGGRPQPAVRTTPAGEIAVDDPADAIPPRAVERPARPRLRTPCGPAGAPRQVRWRVLVEDGLPLTERAFAEEVRDVLCDARGWTASGAVRFRYDPDGPQLISLRAPDGAEARCLALIGLSVRRFYSCGSPVEVVLNADRWFEGSPFWPGSVPGYRRMLVNHEIGHALGRGHQGCDAFGADAPVMMQQSKGVSTGGVVCRANPWPRPDELARL